MLHCIRKASWLSAITASVCFVGTCIAVAAQRSPASLDRGFQLLYNLDFSGAQQQFVSYERQNPDDPMGPAAEAAGLLFAELNRLGVLDSGFFKNSSGSRAKFATDSIAYERFDSALQRADAIARICLSKDRQDHSALLAATLSSGLRADYTALIQRRRVVALHYTKEATTYAQRLLAICPECYDAYVATGISRYLIGTASPLLRWVLKFGGIDGDKQRGIAELQLAAEHARYLGPFARIVLALVYVREKDHSSARMLLAQLQNDFPKNPLFAREMGRLDAGSR